MGTTIAEVKATMRGIMGRIRAQMNVMMAELGNQRVLWQSLVRKHGKAEKDWAEVENLYTHILTVSDEQEVEDGRAAFELFQTELFTLLGRVHDAIDVA